MDLLAMLKALGDRGSYSMLMSRNRRIITEAAQRRKRHRRFARFARQHRIKLHLDRLREAGWSKSEPDSLQHGQPTPHTSTRLAPGEPGLGFDPPSYTRFALGLLLAAPLFRTGWRRRGREATEIGRAWGVEAGRLIALSLVCRGARR